MPPEFIGLAAAVIGLFGVAARVFFWFQGRGDAKKDILIEQQQEILDEVEAKRKRDALIDANPDVVTRLRDHYADKN